MDIKTRCLAAILILCTVGVALQALHTSATGTSSGEDVQADFGGVRPGIQDDRRAATGPADIARPRRDVLLVASLPARQVRADLAADIDLDDPEAGQPHIVVMPIVVSDEMMEISTADDGLSEDDLIGPEVSPAMPIAPSDTDLPAGDDGSLLPLDPALNTLPIDESADEPAADSADPMPVLDSEDSDENPETTADQTGDAVGDGSDGDSQTAPRRPVAPPRVLAPLSPAMAALRDQVRRTLIDYARPQLNTRDNTVSEIITGTLPYGCGTQVILQAGPSARQLNGITCLAWNYPCAGYQPLTLCDDLVTATVGYGRQQMPGEMLAAFAFARVPPDYPARADGVVKTIADLIESEKLECREGVNLSQTLIGLSAYLPEDETEWTNRMGEDWSLERIVQVELAAPVTSEMEDGPRRLLALAYALDARSVSGETPTGELAKAESYLDRYHDFALGIQNSDGSWSAAYLGGRGTSRFPLTQLRSTGYVMEWLALSLPDEMLQDARIVRSVILLNRLLNSPTISSDLSKADSDRIDAVMHALHALAMYDARVFAPHDPKPKAVPSAE